MSRAYSDIAFTAAVRDMQTRMGSRAAYAPLDYTDDRRDALTEAESEFIAARDGFYQATVSESGWPYVQYRGGPAGFLQVLDAKTLGYADFRGNVQYISTGNLQRNDRVSFLLMDYANQRRLKILGRARLVGAADDPALMARLRMPGYPGRVERAVLIAVEAYDWNCPQHITPRFTEAEVDAVTMPLHAEIARLRRATGGTPEDALPSDLGDGDLALRISGIRQLTPRVRAYELRSPGGSNLPAIEAGAHLDVPIRLPSGVTSTRRYSISSDPGRRDAYEVAVLREEAGTGGSRAVHAGYRLGLTLHCRPPGNDFPLPPDDRPVVLIAGGIGITPIRAMAAKLAADARRFEVHYAARSRPEAAYVDELDRSLGHRLHLYLAEHRERIDVRDLLARCPEDAVVYVCGPAGLIDAVASAGRAAGRAAGDLRCERFLPTSGGSSDHEVIVTLKRRRRRITVPADQSILDAIEAAGIPVSSGCRGGTCGTCRVKVLEGDPEHRDAVLSEREHDGGRLMCICVSRAKGTELTLDL